MLVDPNGDVEDTDRSSSEAETVAFIARMRAVCDGEAKLVMLLADETDDGVASVPADLARLPSLSEVTERRQP